MTTETAFKYHPDAEYRFFIYDPEGNGFIYFRSPEERNAHQDMVIQDYLDDGWDESVEQVVAGELTHTVGQVDRTERPPEDQIDEEGCDVEGNYWGEFSYRCGYALLPLASEEAVKAEPQKYDDTLLPFFAMMRKELHANAGKGDRPGWLAMSAETCLLEIFYHLGKLQKAVKKGDGDGMSEYAADVANMCMMLLDICGALHLSASTEPSKPKCDGNHGGPRCADPECWNDDGMDKP